MKDFARMLGLWLLAEVLCLFITLTLSFSAHVIVRLVCAVCTVGIFLALMLQGGYVSAKADKKAHRKANSLRPVCLGCMGSLPPVVFTVLLLLAKCGILPDGFYRIYKLLCAPFWSVCNLLSADVTASAVPAWGFAVLFVLSLLPIPAVLLSYRMTMQDKAPEDVMYRR